MDRLEWLPTMGGGSNTTGRCKYCGASSPVMERTFLATTASDSYPSPDFINEVRWLSESFVDPNGRVFESGGEIYRVLEPNYAARWRELTSQGIIPALIRDGLLVETEQSGAKTRQGETVLRHRRIPVTSFCYEWVPGMLRDAALVTLDLCIRLADKGLTLQDGHPWNILFDGIRPVFIDATSIVPARKDILWAPYQQFCNFFLFPLYLYSSGQDRIARWLLRDHLIGVTDRDLLGALPLTFKLRHPRRTLGVAVPKNLSRLFERLPEHLQERFLAISKIANSGSGNLKLKTGFFESLRRDIAHLKLAGRTSHWARYYAASDKEYFGTDVSPGDWKQKHEAIARLLRDTQPRSVLDVGANTGRYAKLAASVGARVVACDIDVEALTVCYEQSRRENLPILPLVANVFNVSPAPTRGGGASPPPVSRFRSELVMGLAVIHHVVAEQRVSISRITEMFAALTERWLLLEFVMPLRSRIGATPVPGLDDYDAEALERCLRKHFAVVRCLPSYPPERTLFFCEK